MTEAEAHALAAKRNAHKSKHLNKVWLAIPSPEKDGGWTVALHDNHREKAREHAEAAHACAQRGDLRGFMDQAGKALIAGVEAAVLEQ